MKKIWFLTMFCLLIFPVFSQSSWTIEHAIENYVNGLILHRIPQNRDIAVISFQTDRRSVMEYFFDTIQEKFWANGSNIWVYDRHRLERLQYELDFSLSGAINDETAQLAGEIINADVVIYGALHNIGFTYRMTIRAVDVETGQILFPRTYDLELDPILMELLRPPIVEQFEPVYDTFYDYTWEEVIETSDEIDTIPAPTLAQTVSRGFGSSNEPWQNKRFYFRFSFDFPVFAIHQPKDSAEYIFGDETSRVGHAFRFLFGVTIGLELQFLNWMSTEIGVLLRSGDPLDQTALSPGLGLQFKFPYKISGNFILSPYIMGNAQVIISDMYYDLFPPLMGFGGGFQLSVRGPIAGAFIADLNFLYTLFGVVSKNPRGEYWDPERFRWNRYNIGLSIGYKIGFFDR